MLLIYFSGCGLPGRLYPLLPKYLFEKKTNGGGGMNWSKIQVWVESNLDLNLYLNLKHSCHKSEENQINILRKEYKVKKGKYIK